MVIPRKSLWLAVALLVWVLGCPPPPGTVAKQETLEQYAYKTIKLAFDLYDLGMTTAATLHRNKVITDQQWTTVKDKGRVLWNAVRAAEAVSEKYAAAKPGDPEKTALLNDMDRAIGAMLGSKQEFLALIEALQKGGKP